MSVDDAAARTEVIDLVETAGSGGSGKQQQNGKRARSPPVGAHSVDDDDDDAQRTKRTATADTTAAAMAVVETPIKLFATLQDESERSSRNPNKNHWSYTQCQTLREMLRIEGSDAIEWMVVSTYLIDFEFLLYEIPELLTVPTCVVFYGSADSSPNVWQQAASNTSKLDFVCLSPSDPPKSRTNPLDVRIPYGVHHTKLFLVGYANQTCRVVVHTANLRSNDIHVKAQAAYIEDFPIKCSTDSSSTSSSRFEDDLVDYISSYRYNKPWHWHPGTPKPETLHAMLSRYDFSSAKAILLPSVPGYHKLYGTSHTYGHWKLRQLVAEHTRAPSSSTPRPIICQFSSIGSLTEKYLRELQVSMDTSLARIRDRPISTNEPLRLKFVYPTVSDIRDSVEGYRGGGSVPGSTKNVSKPFLRSLFHKWKSSRSNFGKGQNVPHIKTYYQVGEDQNSMDWLVVSSHNMSKVIRPAHSL
jgi:tyrosyl-DNA phosphodiesterase 1